MSRVPVNENGLLDPNDLRKLIDDKTALVSIMWANNETGTIFPIKECAAIAHEHGALFHTDATQTVGKIKINVREMNYQDRKSVV